MNRRPRKQDPDHLAWLRTLPCICCQDNISTEAAHIRMSDARVGKVNPGVGAKPDDKWALPLCGGVDGCHPEQHGMSERKFWEVRGIDPILMALALYSISGDTEEAERIIYAQVIKAFINPMMSD